MNCIKPKEQCQYRSETECIPKYCQKAIDQILTALQSLASDKNTGRDKQYGYKVNR